MPQKRPEVADVENRFKFHPATEKTGPQHDQVRNTMLRVAKQMVRDLPEGRERSLVLTHLEEAMFWANAAIARQPAESSDVPAPQPEKVAPAKKTTRRVTRRSKS